jgi:hypothetical protein
LLKALGDQIDVLRTARLKAAEIIDFKWLNEYPRVLIELAKLARRSAKSPAFSMTMPVKHWVRP